MAKKLQNIVIIGLISLAPTVLVWLPFYLRLNSFWHIPLPTNGMATIVANYDGPLYIVVAKTFYNIGLIKSNFQFPLPVEYYAAHFPLFPILIKAFSFVTGYPYAMLLVTCLSSVAALYFFNKLAKEFVTESSAMWLTCIFSLFPARWLVVRSVGSAEPLFMAAVIASVYYFRNKKYWLAGVFGGLAQVTKSPGILLFIAYGLASLIPFVTSLATSAKKQLEVANLKKLIPLLLIPISLLTIFGLYAITYQDFWAYFHSGDNIHLLFPPFQIFNYSAPWVGTFWQEEIVFIYLIGALGLINLIKQKTGIIAWFVAVFFTSILFVSHRDIVRYSLPVIPFLLIAFAETLCKKEFRWVLALLIIPIYLFSIAFISQNVMPISNWSPFL